MAKEINISRNELWALLVKVFEALFGHRRDYYDMARTVLWLECHGHNGVRHLVEALPILEDTNLPEPTLNEISPTHLVLDGVGRSLLDLGPSLSDLAISCASENGVAKIDLVNVVGAKTLLGVLPFIARQGFHGFAIGSDKISVIGPKMDCPGIFKGSTEEQLSLVCSRDGLDMFEIFKNETPPAVSSEMQTKCFSGCLESGINFPTSEFEVLKKVASGILVEATEASRRGAGE